MYHVKEYPHPVPGNLDLNIADEEEFSPDKLRATMERLYMTVGISLMGSGKQVARLRSWRETRRTSCFAAVSHPLLPNTDALLTQPGILYCMDVRSSRAAFRSHCHCPDYVGTLASDHVPTRTTRAGRR